MVTNTDRDERNERRRARYRAANPKQPLVCADCGAPRKAGNGYCGSCKWRRYYEADPERAKLLQRERTRRRRLASPDKSRADDRRARHGREIAEDWDSLWTSQGGCCYLCGE